MKNASELKNYNSLLERLKHLRRSYVRHKSFQGLLINLSFALGLGLFVLWMNYDFVFPVL